MKTQLKSASHATSSVKKIHYLAFFLAFFLLLLLCIRTETAVDLGLHIKAGEKIIFEKQRIYEDPFTFTLPSHKYIDLSWLFQVIVYSLWHKAGMLGIVSLRSLLVLATFLVLFKTSSISRHNFSIILLLILMVVFICEGRFYTRPELFTYLFLSLTLYILYKYKRGSRKFLPLLVIINLFWANIHGFFILGWFILFCFLISELIEKKKIEDVLLLCTAFSIVVCFLNPYTYEGIIYPFALFRDLRGSIYQTAITELLPPFSGPVENWLILFSPIFLYACLLAISSISILLNFENQSFFNISIYVLFLIISLAVRRNVPLFCFIAVPMTVWNLAQIGTNLPRLKYARRLEISTLIGVLLFVTIIICEVFTNYYYVKDRRQESFGIGISWALPTKALEFAKSQKLKGNVFNHFNFGGHLLWYLFPEHKVFIDGRTEVMGEEHFRYYRQSMETQSAWEDCVNKYEINWVITACEETEFLNMLYRNPNWRPVYFDEVAAIFVKNTSENSEVLKNEIIFEETYPIPSELKKKAFQSFQFHQAQANPIKQFLKRRFYTQKFPYEYIRKGNVFASLGYFNQAEELYLKALLESPDYYESLLNLGNVYLSTGRYQDAARCYSEVLKMNPRDRQIREWAKKCLDDLADKLIFNSYTQ